jgi:hypothetical protein
MSNQFADVCCRGAEGLTALHYCGDNERYVHFCILLALILILVFLHRITKEIVKRDKRVVHIVDNLYQTPLHIFVGVDRHQGNDSNLEPKHL